MASTVATPLERALGRIAGVTELTSQSSLGNTRVTLQFELSRDIDGAAREVQAAIQAARSQLPVEPAQQPDLPQGEPGRRAGDDHRDDLGPPLARPDVRHRLHRSSRNASPRSTAWAR